jgi:hypothetical protein
MSSRKMKKLSVVSGAVVEGTDSESRTNAGVGSRNADGAGATSAVDHATLAVVDGAVHALSF